MGPFNGHGSTAHIERDAAIAGTFLEYPKQVDKPESKGESDESNIYQNHHIIIICYIIMLTI